MTSDEAITLIEAAADPRALFGRDPRRTYRRLARLAHPDANPGSTRAAAAFTRLAALWQHYQGQPGRLAAAGDIANLYEHERGLLKLARDPADSDLLDPGGRRAHPPASRRRPALPAVRPGPSRASAAPGPGYWQ